MLTSVDEYTFTGGNAPPFEWQVFQLWREVYRCTPVELEAVMERFGIQRVMTDAAMLSLAEENARLKRDAFR